MTEIVAVLIFQQMQDADLAKQITIDMSSMQGPAQYRKVSIISISAEPYIKCMDYIRLYSSRVKATDSPLKTH